MRWNAHSIVRSARPACVLAALFITPASLAAQAVPATATPEVTFTKDIAPILQRSCQSCHRPGFGRADVAAHLRRGASVGAGDEDCEPACKASRTRCRPGTSRRTWASSSTRAISPSAMKRSRRSRSGPTAAPRAATRPTCRRRSSSLGAGRVEDWTRPI